MTSGIQATESNQPSGRLRRLINGPTTNRERDCSRALVQSSQGHLHTANAKLLNKDSVTSYPKGACQARKQPTKKKFFSLSLSLWKIYGYKL